MVPLLPVVEVSVERTPGFERHARYMRIWFPEEHKLLRILVGKSPQQHGIDQAEDGSGRADTQSKRNHRNKRKSGILAQHAQAEAQISRQRLQPTCTTRFPAGFLRPIDPAKFHSRPPLRFRWRQSLPNQFRAATLEVEPEFIVHFSFHARAPDSRPQPRSKTGKEAHIFCSTSRTGRFIIVPRDPDCG